MHYLDSGTRSRDDTLYTWLDRALTDASYFACQTGYFNADGLYPLERRLRAVLEAGGQVHLVVGANEDSLKSSDLEYVLDLQEPFGDRGSLVVVSAADVLMHSKTFYTEGTEDRRDALVGSANLTPAGLTANIEAALTVDSVDDPTAPFAAIRAAIDVWRSGQRANGYVVTRANLPDLVIGGVLDRPRPIRPRVRTSSRMRRLFPPLGTIERLARRSRPRSTARQTPPPLTRPSQVLGAATPLPAGVVGIVKQLSRLDVKGFRGEGGTPYIALPTTLMQYLPTRPRGRNGEPRFYVPVVARLDSAPAAYVESGSAPTNVTGVGMGTVVTSHRDLRFNILRVTVSGIESVADSRGVRVPQEGDYVIVEFPVDAPEMRLTFVTEQPLLSRVTALATTEGRLRWGWLPRGFAGNW